MPPSAKQALADQADAIKEAVAAGIFMSYVGSANTPSFFNGIRIQIFKD